MAVALPDYLWVLVVRSFPKLRAATGLHCALASTCRVATEVHRTRRLRTRAAYGHATHALTRHAQLGALGAFIFGFGTGALRVALLSRPRAP
jgi:hypothetical protein